MYVYMDLWRKFFYLPHECKLWNSFAVYVLNTHLPALKSNLLPTIETILRVGDRFFMNRLYEKRLFNNNSPNYSKSSLGNTQDKVSNRISNYIADEVRVIRTKFSFCFINQFVNFIFNFVQTFGNSCCFIREKP